MATYDCYNHYAEVDLDKPLKPEKLDGVLATFDAYGNTFWTKLHRDGQSVSLVGWTVTGYYRGEDGLTWRIAGTLQDGVPVVTLPMGCLAKPGRFTLAIKIGNGISEVTIRIIRGNVVQTVETDLWKDVRDFTAYSNESGKVTFEVTPYVDVQFYRVYEVVDGDTTFVTQMLGKTSITISAADGAHEYCIQPMLENRDGTFIEGNMSDTTGVYVM